MTGSKQSRILSAFVAAMAVLTASATAVLGDESVFIKEGKQLYEKHCSGCHGSVEDSAKAGRSMNRIRSAIRVQPSHRPISMLTDEDILLIAMALKEGEE